VASHWRIRHKLLLGLASVVGILALLMLGSVEGLSSYRTTMNNMDSKLLELRAAQELQDAMNRLAAPPDQREEGIDEVRDLDKKVEAAKDALKAYLKCLQETLDKGRDPDEGFKEKECIKAIDVCFTALDKALSEFDRPRIDMDANFHVRSDTRVNMAMSELLRASDCLQKMIYTDLFERIAEAKHHFRMSMWIVGTMSVVVLLLMLGLSRFFYTWVFYPIRDLEQGVGKVAQGDFEHRIELHSGDEMEELAAAFNDMTGRLQGMYRDLERQVNERSRQLVRSERLASVGFLAAGVAHEINNPLHAIALCSEALESRLGELVARQAATSSRNMADCEVIYKHLKTIQDEAFRCKAITERLLEFSRGGERKREPTPLEELIRSVLDAAEHLPNCRGKRLLFEPASPVVACVNALEIKSVVLNLVVNALDSMDEGGSLTVRLRQLNGQAELVFSDTGCGMEPEVLENIFEPFYTRSRGGKGTGLGLTISHRIISQHRGEIEAASAGRGKGSTFTVRLPLQPADEGFAAKGHRPDETNDDRNTDRVGDGQGRAALGRTAA
jgi:signal transduction histidine kinase